MQFLIQDNRTIAYGIRALTPTEYRCSQIEREALSVVFRYEHFHIYWAVCEFEIITDHIPLLYVWKKINPPLRISCWSLRLLPYKFVMKCPKGEDNIADYLSRGSKRHSLQAMELSQRTQAAVQIVSNLPAPSNGGPIYRLLGMPAMRTR